MEDHRNILRAAGETGAEAAGRLLDVVAAEATHPQSVIGSDYWFEDDGEFDPSANHGVASLAEINDPLDPNNAYLVGLRSDGAGQIIMLQREKRGVVARVVLTLRRGEACTMYGHRQESYGNHLGQTQKIILDGLPAPADVLRDLGALLPAAFEAKRQYIKRQRRSSTWLGRVGLSLEDALGGRFFRGSGKNRPPKALGDA